MCSLFIFIAHFKIIFQRGSTQRLKFLFAHHLFIAYSINWYFDCLNRNFILKEQNFTQNYTKMEPAYYCKFCNAIYSPGMNAEHCRDCRGLLTLLPGYFQQFISFSQFNSVEIQSKSIFFSFFCRWLANKMFNEHVLPRNKRSSK